MEAVAQREVGAAGEGQGEPLQHPRDSDLEATVVVQRLAQVEDHLGAVIADRGRHLARTQHAPVDHLHAGRPGEGRAEGRGGGFGAVFTHAGERCGDVAGRGGAGVAGRRLPWIARGGWRQTIGARSAVCWADAFHSREEWRLVGASFGILVGEEQDPCRCHAGTEGFAESPLSARAILGATHDFQRSLRAPRRAGRRGRKGHTASRRRLPRHAPAAARPEAAAPGADDWGLRPSRVDSTGADSITSTKDHDGCPRGSRQSRGERGCFRVPVCGARDRD